MKRIIILLFVMSLIATSCYKEPYAEGVITPLPAFVDENITFTNYSQNAQSVEWDMGDGTVTTAFNTTYAYDLPGYYEVVLSAIGEKGDINRAFFELEVVGDLKVVVKEYYDEYTVSNARVRLYPTLNDWIDETNLVAESYTNSAGECVFAYLDYQKYYVDVFETWHDNYTLAGEEDGIQWIETPPMNPDVFYTFIAYVDVYDSPAYKSAAKTEKRKLLMLDTSPSITSGRPAKTIVESVPKNKK